VQLFANVGDPRFSTIGAVLTALLFVYVCVIRSWRGVARYRQFVASRETDPNALVRYARRFVGRWWLMAALAGAAVVMSPGVTWASVGLAWPSGLMAWAMVGAVLIALSLAPWRVRIAVSRGRLPNRTSVAALHPRTAPERRAIVAMGVTAGIAEEFVFRGLFVAAGVGLLGLDPLLAGLIVAVIFGLCHAYQGVLGVLRTTWFGLLVTVMYGVAGSLLPAVIFHVVVDLYAFLLWPPPGTTGRAAPATKAAPDSVPAPDDVPGVAPDSASGAASGPVRSATPEPEPGD